MRKLWSRLVTVALILVVIIQVGAAQGGLDSGTSAFSFVDEVFPHTEVNDSGDFVYSILLPFAGLMAILYFILLGVFNWAADSMPGDTVAKRSAKVLSAVLALMGLRLFNLTSIFPLLILAAIAGIIYALYKWLGGFSLPGIGGGTTGGGGNSPSLNVSVNKAGGGTINDSTSTDDIEFQIQVSDNSGSGLDEVEVGLPSAGSSHTEPLSGSSDAVTVTVTDISGGSTTLSPGSKPYAVEAFDNDGNDEDTSSFFNVQSGGGTSSDPPTFRSLSASNASSGASAADISVSYSVVDSSGSGLSNLEIEVPGVGVGTIGVSGASDSGSQDLASIIGSNPSLSDGNYDINGMVIDGNGNSDSKSSQFRVGSRGSGGSGGSTGGGDNIQNLQAILDNGGAGGGNGGSTNVNVNQQQMQQQFQFMMQMMQQMQQQQMMGGMATPAMAQFGNLIQGNVQIGNGNVMIPGGGSGDTQIDIQVVQQLIQVLSQTEVNEEVFMSIMAMLMMRGDQGLNQQLIQQIIDIDIEENQGDLTIEQELIQIIDTDHITEIENTFVNIFENEYNLSPEQKKFALQIKSFFQAVHTTSFDIEGEQVIINIKNDVGEVEIHYALLLELLKLIDRLPESGISVLVHRILNKIVIDGGQSSFSVEIIREIIQIIKVVDEGGGSEGDAPEQADIKVEALNLLSNESGNPVPRVRAEGGNYFYVIPAGAKTGMVAIHAQVGCNRKNGLQQIVYNFDNQQKSVGLNDSSYGYEDEEMVNLSQIVGNRKFQQGDTHSFGITVIGQAGNRQDKVMQIYVAGPGGTIQPDNTPALPPGDTKQPPGLTSGPDRKDLPSGEETKEIVDELEKIPELNLEDIRRADEILKQILDQDRMSEQLDEEMLNDLQDAMNSFEDAHSHSEHIEKIMNQTDNPLEAAKYAQKNDNDVSKIKNDLENAEGDIKEFMQDLGQKEKIFGEEEEELHSLDDLTGNLRKHMEQLSEMEGYIEKLRQMKNSQ